MGIEKLKAAHTQAQSASTKSAKQARAKKAQAVVAALDPASVPWFDESYSFADRERELALLDNLLTTQLSSIRRERAFIRQQVASGDFGLPVAEPAPEASPNNTDHKE